MLNISARNQFAGTIRNVQEGAVNAIVTIEAAGQQITADITMGSVKRLDLEAGKKAVAVVKATNVMVATSGLQLSARNQLAGRVTSIQRGAVNAIVELDCSGLKVTSDITMASVERLGLAEDCNAVAIIKATDVMVGIED